MAQNLSHRAERKKGRAMNFPVQTITARKQKAYIGVATVLVDANKADVIYVAPTAELLTASIKKEFPNLQFDPAKFQPVAILHYKP